MLVLKIDYEKCYNALIEKLAILADSLIDEMYTQSTEQMTSGEKDSVEKETAQFIEGRIRGQIIYGALALMKSFGTGSQMDRNNPYLQAYMNSPKWNPLRSKTALTIVGRSADGGNEYENIFDKPGEKSGYTTGKMAGLNLEKKIKPKTPTNTIIRMEQDYIRGQQTKVDTELTRVLKEFFENDFRKYLYNSII